MTKQPDLVMEPRFDVWANRLARLPYLARIALALLIALELTVLLSVVIDRVLIDAVLAGDVAPVVPALIAAIIGVVLYGVGWWAMIGFDDSSPGAWRPGTPAVIYAAAGAAGLVIGVALIVFGLVFGYLL